MGPFDIATLGGFAVAAGAVVVSPGPDTLLMLRYSLTSGRGVGLATVAGIQIGLIGHTLLAVTGISVMVASSPTLFRAVAVLGAAYIGWLGWQGLRGTGGISGIDGGGTVTAGKGLRDGIFCNLLNPKVILLFLALFPHFVHVERGQVTLQLATLAALLIAINILWQAPLAWAADRARHWIGRETVRMAITRGTGAAFLLFAALMLYEHLA